MYERALIYPNSDGSWGYRMNTNTEKISRVNLEKVYTQKVAHISVSAAPVRTPTSAATVSSTYEATATPTTSAISVTTTTLGLKPQVRSIDPESATAGNTVSITDLEGYNFQSNATVALARSGDNNIPGTNVKVVSTTQITCTFVIPLTATVGAWDILVTNPDGQFHRYLNGFTVRENMNPTATTTTTTTTTSSGSVTVTSLEPSVIVTGGSALYSQHLTITGTGITTAYTAYLRRSGSNDIKGTYLYMPSTTQLTVSVDIPTGSAGTWNVIIVDSNGNTLGTLVNGMNIN
jgi:hypothetical protein